MMVPTNSGAAGASGATEYSTTNTQVASVDEADYIKNDSNTIFVLSADGLHIIDAWPAAQTHEIAHLTLTGEPRRMYLLDNRLVVLHARASHQHEWRRGQFQSLGPGLHLWLRVPLL